MFISKKIVLLLFVLIAVSKIYPYSFAESFIANYDLTKRDTHEYNPYTLAKAKNSFLQLEKRLQEEGFVLDARYVILGYQEEAIPPYTTDWERQAIKDEIIVETAAGISAPSRNIFGFITGFLLKDTEWMEKHWNKSAVTQMMHICAKPIKLFNDEALVFQKHAFGSDYDFIIRVRNRIESALHSKNISLVLKELIAFWSEMQERSSKTGSQEEVATQDMDFSLSYAQAIVDGITPVRNIFIGPDITYPIEVLSMQSEQATLHAQTFIKKFEKKLIPVDNESTAYIFCSFVDGVGKSTLLNNMKNYMKHGANFNVYERSDNSSSQIATILQYKPNVYMVDLPGQMSHFTCKPDGYVFSDIQTITSITHQILSRLRVYIQTHASTLSAAFMQLVERTANINQSLYEETDLVKVFAQNCACLDMKNIRWIPVLFEGNIYIFNKDDQSKIRMLVPLEAAHSLGLKVVEPEQMLFTKGLSLPMDYEVFLKDLLVKLRSVGIKNIRFVDFLSMYPRSSRETIRLNFVLQYLKKLFGEKYALEHSFYNHKVHSAQETCGLLVDRFHQSVTHLVAETALRLAIDRTMQKYAQDKVSYLAGKELELIIKEELEAILSNELDALTTLAQNRLEPEREKYFHLYQFDRIYQAIIKLQPQMLLLLSQMILQLSTDYLQNAHIKNLWLDFSEDWVKGSDRLTNGIPVRNLNVINGVCKDQTLLSGFIKTVRSMCYVQASNLLQTVPGEDDSYTVPSIICGVAPFKVVYKEGLYYLLQKRLPLLSTTISDIGFIWNGISGFDKNKHIPQLIKFNVSSKSGNGLWGLFEDIPYYLDWHTRNTNFGVYAYSYTNITKNVVTKLVDASIKSMINAGNSNPYIATSQLLLLLQDQKIYQTLLKEIEQKKPQEVLAHDPRLKGIRLWARIIATIELICKDPNSKIMARSDNKDDFIATIKLLELITLPYFFSIKLKQPLFDDYDSILPVIPVPLG